MTEPLLFIFAKFTLSIMRRMRDEIKINSYYMEVFIMENKTNVAKTTVVRKRYVITSDGMRMSYEEYIDMINSEKN